MRRVRVLRGIRKKTSATAGVYTQFSAMLNLSLRWAMSTRRTRQTILYFALWWVVTTHIECSAVSGDPFYVHWGHTRHHTYIFSVSFFVRHLSACQEQLQTCLARARCQHVFPRRIREKRWRPFGVMWRSHMTKRDVGIQINIFLYFFVENPELSSFSMGNAFVNQSILVI